MSAGAFLRLPGAVPVRRLSAGQRDALAQRLLPGWRAWCADWSLARADVRVEPLVQGAARVRPSDGWRVAGRLDGGVGSLGGSGGAGRSGGAVGGSVGGYMGGDIDGDSVGDVGGDVGGALVRESGREALTAAAMDLPGETAWPQDSLAASFAASVEASWRAWRDGWLGAVSPADEAPAGETAEPTSAAELGELVLTFSCVRAGNAASAEPVERTVRVAASSLMALLPSASAGDAAAASASARGALAPLPRAIAHLPVRVRVHLGQAALQMGQLMDLQPGDVIPLAHPLARPAGLTFAEPGGLPLAAEARLGRSGPHWAVRVDPAPPTTS
ncbi:FliM/FliN family flagellar motor C-terminal domain-containing protein [Roseateles chitinivorans]|uniref:FliM/FliN family flagellar motor switch protein n=1 Tax=Roseateles chitinivorans TaxID=2917965 RepID=UPI003D6658C2